MEWQGRRTLHAEPKGDSYWKLKAFDVFVDDWAALITAHADLFGSGAVDEVIRSHSARVNLFSAPFLAELAQAGAFTAADLARPHFSTAVHASPFGSRAALAIPELVLAASRARESLRRLRRAIKR